MDEQREYFLQKLVKGVWTNIIKSYECGELIYAGTLRRQKGECCRIIDNKGSIIWHAKGAPFTEGARGNG